MKFVLFAIINYILGSINWALVIGKVFYKTDVREYGSGNLGATNAGRVLGKKVAIIVAAMDALKGMVAFLILKQFDYNSALFGSVFCVIGHCWPVFANFKGGKGVATTAGIVIGYCIGSWKAIVFGAIVPVIVWKLVSNSSYVSLGSIVALITASVMSFFVNSLPVALTTTAVSALVIYCHRANIKRLIDGTEHKANY